LKTYQARRSAVAMIRPFVKRSRTKCEIPDSMWFDPYFVGFMGMLITLAASRSGQSFDTDDLAAVQSGSWAAITGMNADLIGDEICALSAACDKRFDLGCRNALSFFQTFQSDQLNAPFLRGEAAEQVQTSAVVWSRHFEAFVTEYLSVHMR
jgi:hypothetical protein